MKFYVPLAGPTQAEEAYSRLASLAADQADRSLVERRIRKLEYSVAGRPVAAEVGQPALNDDRNRVRAIFEAGNFIVMTCDQRGNDTGSYNVIASGVTSVEEFDAPVEAESEASTSRA